MEVAVDQILRSPGELALVQAVALRALEQRHHAVLGHEFHDAFGRHRYPHALQFQVHALVAIALLAVLERLLDQGKQPRIPVRPPHGVEPVMVGAVREPDHGQQAFHAHALSLTDLLDENRLLSVGQVFRICTRLFSQQLQRAPADRDLDAELPPLPPLPLDVGVQLVQTGPHPRQPLLHRRQRVRQTGRIPRTGGHRRRIRNHGPCAASVPGSFPAFSRHVRLLGSGEHLSFPFSHDRGLHAQFGGRLMRFQPSGRDRHHRLPLQLLGHRPVSQPAPAGRQLVDPRHEQFLAFRIAEHPHGAAEPSALEVMVHRRALLLLAVTPLPPPRLEGTPARSPSSRSRYHIRKASLLGYPSSWIASAAQHSYLIYKSTARSRCCLLYVMTTPSLTQRVQKTSPPQTKTPT